MGYYVSVNNVNIFVEDLNPAAQEAILFLHGWPGDHNLFEYQFDRLPQMGYRCVGMDTRGFGSSDKPYSGYDYDTLADDVRGVVEALGLRHFTLLGHSTGGAMAVRYMARHRGYGVKKLVLAAAAAPSLIKRPNFPYGIDESAVTQIIDETLRDRPQMLRDFGNSFFYQHTTAAFSDWFFMLGLKAAGWATAAVAQTWIRETLFSDLEAIAVPTLIMQGRHDLIVPFALSEIQQQMIKDAVLVPFEFSGHGVFYDQKDDFNDVLVRFIES
jgi:pimeloyl-ACP methyl ester carboxylesterase